MANGAAQKVTNFPTPLNSTCDLLLGDKDGFAVVAQCTSTPPTTTDTFAHGCIISQKDTTTGTRAIYENIGSTTTPSWNLIGTLNGTTYSEVAVSVPSSTPVSLFGATNGFAGTLTSLEVISLDDAVGTVTVRTSAGVVSTIVKASANQVRGSSCNNATFTAAQSVTAVNSTTSGALLKATFTVTT